MATYAARVNSAAAAPLLGPTIPSDDIFGANEAVTGAIDAFELPAVADVRAPPSHCFPPRLRLALNGMPRVGLGCNCTVIAFLSPC